MNENLDTLIQHRCRTASPSKSFAKGMNRALAAIREEAAQAAASAGTSSTAGASALPRGPETFRPAASCRIPRWLPRMAAAAAIAALCIGGTAYAANALGFLELKTGDFQADVAPQLGDYSPQAAPQEGTVETVRIDLSYLPEALPDRYLGEDSGSLATEVPAGYSQFSSSIDYRTLYVDTPDTAPFSSLEASETLQINGREAILLEFNHGIYDGKEHKRLELFVNFPEHRRIINVSTNEASLHDELIKVAEGMTLSPTGEYVPVDHEFLWSRAAQQAGEDALDRRDTAAQGGIQSWHPVPEEGLSDDEMGAFLAPGDVFHPGGIAAVEGRVTRVTASEDASMLDSGLMPFNWADFIRDDGTLTSDDIVFVAHGDGQSAMDEVVDRQTSQLKAVVADITFKNTGTEALSEIPTYVYLESVDHRDGLWYPYDRTASLPANVEAQNSAFINNSFCDYREALSDNVRWGGSEGGISLDAGEEATLRFAWIVNGDELDKLLLLVDPDGYGEAAGLDFGQRFVDIRQ